MRRKATVILCSMFLTMSAVGQVKACNTEKINDTGKVLENAALLPARTLALVSGCAIGVPIAVTRKSVHNAVSISGDLARPYVDSYEELFLTLPVTSLVGIPLGIASGTAQGVYLGCKNALSNCVDKPFSAESFSLRNLD